MRILVISNYYPPLEIGGWEQLTHEVVELLRKRGHTICVLTSNHHKEEIVGAESLIERSLHLESADHQRYHPHYVLLQNWHKRKNSEILTRITIDFSPDLIFINGMWNLPLSVAQESERLIPGRVVYYVASTWPTDLDAHTAFWAAPTNRNWMKSPKKWLRKLVFEKMNPVVPRNHLAFEHVLCVSSFIQRYMVKEVGVPIEKTRVIYNGINVEDFFWKKQNVIDSGNVQLLYAGGLWEIKGVHTLMEAVGFLVNQFAFKDFHLTLVGDGNLSYINYLHYLAQDLNIEDYITFNARIPRNDMPKLFRKFDVLLFPSQGPEALPRIVQEAMASGLVVIASNIGGTQEILHHDVNGLSFEAGDACMLANRIVQVAKDATLRDRLSTMARRMIAEKFTIFRMVNDVEDYLTSVLECTKF